MIKVNLSLFFEKKINIANTSHLRYKCITYPLELETYFFAHIKSWSKILSDPFTWKTLRLSEYFMCVSGMKSCMGIDVSFFLKKILNWWLNDYRRLISYDPFNRWHEELHAYMCMNVSLFLKNKLKWKFKMIVTNKFSFFEKAKSWKRIFWTSKFRASRIFINW